MAGGHGERLGSRAWWVRVEQNGRPRGRDRRSPAWKGDGRDRQPYFHRRYHGKALPTAGTPTTTTPVVDDHAHATQRAEGFPAHAAGDADARGGGFATRHAPAHARFAARGSSHAGRCGAHLVHVAGAGPRHQRVRRRAHPHRARPVAVGHRRNLPVLADGPVTHRGDRASLHPAAGDAAGAGPVPGAGVRAGYGVQPAGLEPAGGEAVRPGRIQRPVRRQPHLERVHESGAAPAVPGFRERRAEPAGHVPHELRGAPRRHPL